MLNIYSDISSHLQHIHFAKYEICNNCTLQYVYFLTHALCNMLILQHIHFASWTLWNMCILKISLIRFYISLIKYLEFYFFMFERFPKLSFWRSLNPYQTEWGPNCPPGFKSLISLEPKVGFTSNQAVNLSFTVV